MYSIVHRKDVKSLNSEKNKIYQVKYQSYYLDAHIIAIGSRADCNKEMEIRVAKGKSTKSEKSKI